MRRVALAGLLACFVAASCASAEVREDVVYDARFGEATSMDVYLPDDDERAHAAVLLVHGGGWSIGSKDAYDNMGKRLAHAGWVAASIEYRLGDDGVYPRAVQDTVCALSYLRNHARELRVDPARVAVLGYSAGGHLAALVGVAADRPPHVPDCAEGPTAPPAAVISGAPILDLRGKGGARAVRDFLGGTEAQVPEAYRSASPLLHVSPAAPPFLFIVGGGDWFVGDEDSERMRAALRSVGVQAELLRVTGTGHITGPGVEPGELAVGTSEKSPEAWLAIVDFLQRTMGRP